MYQYHWSCNAIDDYTLTLVWNSSFFNSSYRCLHFLPFLVPLIQRQQIDSIICLLCTTFVCFLEIIKLIRQRWRAIWSECCKRPSSFRWAICKCHWIIDWIMSNKRSITSRSRTMCLWWVTQDRAISGFRGCCGYCCTTVTFLRKRHAITPAWLATHRLSSWVARNICIVCRDLPCSRRTYRSVCAPSPSTQGIRVNYQFKLSPTKSNQS